MRKASSVRLDKLPHPAARILLGCGWAVAVEMAAVPQLLTLAVAAATAFLFAPSRQQLLRLLRRTRWLLAVLLLTYAFAVPGTPVWAELGWASPSSQGVGQGALRVARVAMLLAGLAVLLAYTARPRLIYGLYALGAPLAAIGFDRRAFAVRLGLTLDLVERQPQANLLAALRSQPSEDATPPTYTLELEAWRPTDSVLVLAAVVASVALWATRLP